MTIPKRLMAVAALALGTAAIAATSALAEDPLGPVQHDVDGGATFGSDTTAPMVRLDGPRGSVRGLAWTQPGGLDLWREQTAADGSLQFYAYKPPGAGAGAFAGNPLGLSTQEVALGAPTVLTTNGPPLDNGYATYGALENVSNPGPASGYGRRTDCYTSASAGTFEICSGILQIVRVPHVASGGQYLSQWLVNISPQDLAAGWGSFIAEINPVNRGDDQGWSDARSKLSRWVGGIQMVPESQTFGEPGTGRNVLFGFLVAHSGAPNAFGSPAKTYNPFMAEADSIAPGGRGIYLGGDTTGVASNLPYAPLQAAGTWQHGLDLTPATFVDGLALRTDAAISAAAYRVGATPGVSCRAGTVSLATLTITNGIVTHC